MVQRRARRRPDDRHGAAAARLRRGIRADAAVYDVGCAGLITHVERLSDGRFNIVLRGLEKFRVERRAPADRHGSLSRGADLPAGRSAHRRRPCSAATTARELETLLAPLFSGTRAEPACRRSCRTKTWSTRWRSISSSNRSRSRRCSSARPAGALPALVELLEMKSFGEGHEGRTVH